MFKKPFMANYLELFLFFLNCSNFGKSIVCCKHGYWLFRQAQRKIGLGCFHNRYTKVVYISFKLIVEDGHKNKNKIYFFLINFVPFFWKSFQDSKTKDEIFTVILGHDDASDHKSSTSVDRKAWCLVLFLISHFKRHEFIYIL